MYSLIKRTMPAKGPLQSPVARRHPHTDLNRDTGDEWASWSRHQVEGHRCPALKVVVVVELAARAHKAMPEECRLQSGRQLCGLVSVPRCNFTNLGIDVFT